MPEPRSAILAQARRPPRDRPDAAGLPGRRSARANWRKTSLDAMRDPRARTDLGDQVPLGDQLLERGEHRRARNLELLGKSPRGRDVLTRTQSPGHDRCLIPVVDLPVDR